MMRRFRILTLAKEMAGDQQRTVLWFEHQPIPGWAGKTAYDLVHEGRADQVLASFRPQTANV